MRWATSPRAIRARRLGRGGLAARLQAFAPPNSCVIADTTRRLVGALFEYEDIGSVALKGFSVPVQAWRVLSESRVESRFEALRGGAATLAPLVGREEELDLLLRRWQQAKEGQGRVVLLSGEPGIGKSRLVASLPQHLAGQAYVRVQYFCSPHHQNSALYPVVAHLKRAAGFDGHEHGRKMKDRMILRSPHPEQSRLTE